MPTGAFLGDQLTPDSRAGGSYSMTGTGAPSQPKTVSGWDAQMQGAWPGTPAGSTGASAGSSTAAPTSIQRGMGQFPLGQGPSATMPGSIAQYPTSVTGFGVNGQGGVQSFVNTLYGPQQQLLADQLARQQQALGMIGVDADYKADALRRDNTLAQQSLGLDRQALGIDKSLINTQLSNLSRLRSILGQRRGLAGESKSLDAAKARDMAQRKTFDLRSDLTARGAFNTVANERGTGRVARDLMYELGGINLQYRNTLLGLNEQGIGYDNQQAQLQSRLKGIGLDAAKLDLSEEQLENALADGLHTIGMGSFTSINGLLDAMAGTNTQQANLATQIMQEVISYSNLPPEVIAQITASLGMPAPTSSSSTTTRDTRLTDSRVPR